MCLLDHSQAVFRFGYEGTSTLSPREFWLKLLTQKDRDVLEEEYGVDRYEAWYRDEYFENHFAISLGKLSLMLPPDFIENPKSYN